MGRWGWPAQVTDARASARTLSWGRGDIARTFQKRVAAGLQAGRDFVIPNQQDQAKDTTDFDLITWLVIKKP